MVYLAVTNANTTFTNSITLKQRLIFSPPIFYPNWTLSNESEARFPIGDAFLAASIGDKVIIWGGLQLTESGTVNYFFHSDVVYSFTPNDESGVWKAMKATGTIHPGTYFNGFAVLDSKIFIFGGPDRQNFTNALSTLDSNGHFERLYPEGWIPSPRYGNQGFAHNGKFYFIGGVVKQINESRKEDYIKSKSGYIYTNEFVEYDPKSNAFTQLYIKGTHHSPRMASALAVLGDQVFIHGGHAPKGTSYVSLNDFYVLDMKSFKLTEIKETGYFEAMHHHEAISLSDRHILFVGGVSHPTGNVTNQVKIFDAKTNQWKEEEPLSFEIGAGLQVHRAIRFPDKNNSVAVLCMGGFIDSLFHTHSSYMVLFNISFN